MTKRNLGVVIVFLLGCATGGVSSQLVVPLASAQQAAQLPKWEYNCPYLEDPKQLAAVPNKFGEQGWEMVSYSMNPWGGGAACFKRPK